MALIDELRQKTPALQNYSDAEIASALRQKPQFKDMPEAEFQAQVRGRSLPSAEKDEPGFGAGFSAGIDQLQAMGGGLVMAAGEKLGSEGMWNAGRDIYADNMAEANENALGYGFTDLFSDPETSAMQWASYTAGNLLPMMATSLASGGAGGLAAGAGAKMLAGSVAKQAAARAGQAIGAYAGSAGMETGAIMGEVENADVALAHGSIAGALDALPIMRVLRKVGGDKLAGKAADEISTSALKDLRRNAGRTVKGAAGRGALTQALAEASTEGLQGLIGQHASYWVDNNASLLNNLGDVDWKAMIDEGAAGGLMGGIMGAPSGVIERGRAKSQAERIEAAREQVAQEGGDALDQAMAGQQAEQSAQAESEAEANGIDPAELGNRIQITRDAATDLERQAQGSEQGKARLRNMEMLVSRAEAQYDSGQIASAERVARQAERLAQRLTRDFNRSGSRENPAQGVWEQTPPFGGLLGRDGEQEKIGWNGEVIRGEGPVADQTQYDPQARNVRRDEGLAAQRQGAERMREQQANARPQIADQGIVYGQGPVAGNANTGLDQPVQDPRFTDTGAREQTEASRARQQQAAEAAAQVARTRGQSETAYLSDNTPVGTRFRVMDLAELRPSNTADGKVNPDYPQELQPRDRTNANSQVQVRNIASRLNPERLGSSSDASSGAPIVGSDGVVESGNGRTMAIEQVYRANGQQAQAYRDFVRRQAADQGMDPSAVDDMQRPVLVRERTSNIDRADFARRANESQVAGMTAYEQAQADADTLTADDLQFWAPDQSGDPLAASNRGFQRRFVQQLGNNEAARYTTRDGQASPELGQRMQRAMFAKAYQDADMVEMATEQGDQMRNLTAALQVAAPDLAMAREAGSQEALDAIGTINDAVRLLRNARQSGMSVRELSRQTDAFTDPVPDTTALLAVSFSSNLRSRQAMTEAMRYIGQSVRQRAESESNGALFEDTTTNEDVFNAALQDRDQRAEESSSESNVQSGAERGERGPAEERQTETAQGAQEGRQAETVDDAPLLATYDEQELADREQAQQQAEAAEADRRRQEEQRASADAEADDFRLSGSDRAADVAAAGGQQDLTDAPQRAEQAAQENGAENGSDGQAVSQMASPTGSEAFRRWFGDSQIVNPDGSPQVVYHGTESDFSEFRAGDDTGGLIFFSPQSRVASEYATGAHSYDRMNEAYIGFQVMAKDHPGVFDMATGRVNRSADPDEVSDAADEVIYDEAFWSSEPSVSEIASRMEQEFVEAQRGANLMPAYLRIERPYGSTDNPVSFREAEGIGAEQLRRMGHDGVIASEGSQQGVSYAVLNPRQVKSAIGNRGTYDPDNADIRYSMGGDQQAAPRAEDIITTLEGIKELADTKVIQSAQELPETALIGMALRGINPADVRGMYIGGDLYVVADNLDSAQEGIEVAIHEAVGHKGMRGVLGEDLDRVMLDLYRSLPNSKKGRQALAEVRRDYPFLDPAKREDRVTIGEEMVAHMLEKGVRPKAWQKAVAKIRELLRRVFPSIAWTYTDVLALGEKSRDYLRRQQAEAGREAGPRYSVSRRGDTDLSARDLAAQLREEHEGLKLDLMGRGDVITVSRIVVPPDARETGVGSEVMQRITDWADVNGKTLALTPSGDFGGSKRRLQSFYKRLGFEDNKGSARDYAISESMYRLPEGSDGQLYSLRRKQAEPVADQFDDLTEAGRSMMGKFGESTPPKRFAEWYKSVADRAALKIRQGMVDKVAGLKELDEKLLGESMYKENITRSSWVLARMSNAANGALHAMLHTGRIALDPEQKILKLKDDDSKGLGAVLGQLGSSAEIQRFMMWIAANRSNRLNDEGREFLFDEAEIQAGMRFNEGTMADGRSRREAYDQAFKEFQQYRDDVLAVAEQAGIIKPEQREQWAEEFYVPFYRLSEEKGAPTGQMATAGLSRQQAYKRLKGGTQNINDLLQNTMMNFHHLLDASLKNQAASQAVENAKAMGMARRVPESNRDTSTSTFVMEGGQKAFYEVDDPIVFQSLTALAHPGMNSSLMKVMRVFKRIFTNLTTTTPQFMVANLIRDSLQASATSDVSKNAFANVALGAKTLKDARIKAQMMASGASFNFGHLYGNNPDELRGQLTRTMRDAKVIDGPYAVPDLLRAGWAKWNDFNNTAENLNRAAIYAENRDKGELRAAFESRDLIDFSSHGAWPAVRILIDIVPFLNARIQGLDKIYRSGVKPGTSVLAEAFGKGKANVTDKQAAARFWTVTGAVTLATVALYLNNQDDEEYQKLEDWQKDTYWFFRVGEQAFFIPKPFEVGAIATMAERMTEQFVDDEATGKLFVERMRHMMTDTFSFSPVPQMVQPALDVYANYDAFTQRPIESMGMDRLSPELRRRTSTTQLASGISSLLNSTVGAIGNSETNPLALSPVQVDHLISGYLGQVGSWAAASGDVAWNVATGRDDPDRKWYEYQPIRRFYQNLGDEDRYTKYGTVFYEGLREAGRAYADVKELRELGRLEDAAAVANDQRAMLGLRKRLNRAQSRLRTIKQQMDMIRRSNIDGELKRQRLDRLRAKQNLIQEALGKQILEVRAES